jgi:hypothetical protein
MLSKKRFRRRRSARLIHEADMSAMRARHSTLEQFMANEVEYESSTERMVIRQRIHLDAARALREFTAEIIEHDSAIVH